MHRAIQWSLAGLFAMVIVGAGPATAPAEKKAINEFCAVEKGNKIDPKVTVEYKDQVIGFCCAECPPKFQKDPEKYMKGLK